MVRWTTAFGHAQLSGEFLTISDDSHTKHSHREMMDNSEAQIIIIGFVWNDHNIDPFTITVQQACSVS